MLFGKGHTFQLKYPQSRLRMARFRGGNKAEFTDNRQVIGNIFSLYQRAQDFLLEHIQIAGKLEEGQFVRTDVPGYPLDALREALANALCHRDYTEGGGAVDLAIYDDRIEIVSSGTLHFGLTVESLLTEHQSRPWNPVIADVLYKRGVIESWGRGTLKMIESTRQVGLVSPEFEVSPHSFTVRFRSREYMPPTRVSHDLTPLHRQILACLQTLGPSSSSQVVAALPTAVEPKTVLRNLQLLREFGMVAMTGERRGAKWFLSHDDGSASS
ncbi:MAG: ATP-binding protein [Thermomicrobiales bacterium]